MSKNEKVDFDELVDPFDSESDLEITEADIDELIQNPEIIAKLDGEDLYLLLVKIYKKLDEDHKLREKFEKSLDEIINK